jgi:hypothetical protein
VFSLIPDRIEAVESGIPLPSSFISRLACLSVTIGLLGDPTAYRTDGYEEPDPAILIVVTPQF